MKKIRFDHLKPEVATHIFEDFLPGNSIYAGGMFFQKAGEVSHENDNGSPVHVHEDCELFCFFQGKAMVEVDGVKHPAEAGDVFLIEPGEDHHIISGEDELPIGIWCHACVKE